MAIKRIAIALVMGLIFVLSGPLAVHAADYQTVESVKAYRHLLETDDMLVVFHYDIHYDTVPDQPLNKYYHFRLMDADGVTELAAASPYTYYNSGYDEGAGAFYLSSADAPLWGGAYILQISGNPEYHAAPVPQILYTLEGEDYSALDTPEGNQELLGDYIIQVAQSLQASWGVEMTVNADAGDILTSAAESYFKGAITGLQYMAPQIFAVQEGQVPTPSPLHSGTSQADTYRDRYDGTFIGDFLDDGLFGVPGNVVTGVGILAMCMILFFLSFKLFQTSIPGMVGAYLLVIMGFLMGFVATAIFAIVSLLAAIYIAYVLFFRNSSG